MSSNGRVIHCISAYLPSYITLIRLLLVSSTHTNFLLFQSFILLYFTTDNADIYFTKPRRKIIKWITLFLFVRATDQNITLRITCFVRWLLACKEYSATIWENSICKNWIYFSYQAFNKDKTTSTWNISGKDFYPEFLLLLINSFPICGRKITFLCKLINTGLE